LVLNQVLQALGKRAFNTRFNQGRVILKVIHLKGTGINFSGTREIVYGTAVAHQNKKK
jgi:hypothetical protein